jgi:peptidylprolyl isomerase
LQTSIETIVYDISSKRKSAAIDGVKKSRTLIKQSAKKMTDSCQDANACSSILASMTERLDPLEDSLRNALDAFNGSDQERAALDKAYESQDSLQKDMTALEEQMIPKGFVRPVPSEYADLPQLQGRATIEFTIKKPDGSPFNVEGVLSKEANLKMVIDGYNAPLTGGNFVQLVSKGFYKNMAIQRSDGFVVQTGDPEGEADGYVGTANKSVGAGKHGERLIPLEIMMKGDKEPVYESTMEDEGRGGEATVLPFSSYGAMGWARDEYEPNSGSSQFFWLLFDSDLTPAGKNVLDGRYPW